MRVKKDFSLYFHLEKLRWGYSFYFFLCSNNVSSPKHFNFLESRKLQFIQNTFSMYFWYYRPSRNKFFHIKCLTFFIIIFKQTKIAKKATMEWDRYLIHLIRILRRLEEVCWSHLGHIKIKKNSCLSLSHLCRKVRVMGLRQ